MKKTASAGACAGAGSKCVARKAALGESGERPLDQGEDEKGGGTEKAVPDKQSDEERNLCLRNLGDCTLASLTEQFVRHFHRRTHDAFDFLAHDFPSLFIARLSIA